MMYFSYSQARLLQSCPRAYEISYIKKKKTPQNKDMFLGSTLHHSYATFQNLKMQETLLGVDDVVQLFIQDFDSMVASGYQGVNWKKSKPAEVRETGIGMVKAYYPIASQIETIAVEESFNTEIEVDGEIITITGKIDFLDKAGDPYDIKSTGKLPKQIGTLNLLQPVFYAICLNAQRLDRFLYHYVVGSEQPFFKSMTVAVKEQNISWVRSLAIPLWIRQIRSGIFPPNVNECHWCDAREFDYCKGFGEA